MRIVACSLECLANCPECHGHGTTYAYFHDSRDYGPGARALYRGIEQTPNGGFKVNMADQAKAAEVLAKHLGMFVDRQVNLVGDLSSLSTNDLRTAIVGMLGSNVDLGGLINLLKGEDGVYRGSDPVVTGPTDAGAAISDS